METDLIYAVDFALPLGSEIRAAKDGVVFDYYLGGDWCYQGLDPEIGNNPPPLSTNFMILMHEDGTMTWYSHLSNEVLVKRGQVIKKGEIIAKSGLSGWVAGIPHVHFQANTRALPRNSTPILFEEWPYPLDHNTLDKQGKIWWG